MSSDVVIHRVCRSLNRPLTIWGIERRFFFLALVIGSATFNFFASLLAGLLMFTVLFVLGKWASGNDPQILRILLNSTRFRSRYDAAKFAPTSTRRIR